MELLFERKKFPKAPDGDRYEWIETETQFRISQKSRVLIKIAASARNAAQNHSTDDDDLRVALNGYEFGKYEIHDEKVSWKGFGTASSWNGASLKGMNKTIYFFVELPKGEHTIQFYADKKPTLRELKIYQLESGEVFQLRDQTPTGEISVSQRGIPWMSFIFLGVKPKDFSITAFEIEIQISDTIHITQ